MKTSSLVPFRVSVPFQCEIFWMGLIVNVQPPEAVMLNATEWLFSSNMTLPWYLPISFTRLHGPC
jgi:hypothetical protein